MLQTFQIEGLGLDWQAPTGLWSIVCYDVFVSAIILVYSSPAIREGVYCMLYRLAKVAGPLRLRELSYQATITHGQAHPLSASVQWTTKSDNGEGLWSLAAAAWFITVCNPPTSHHTVTSHILASQGLSAQPSLCWHKLAVVHEASTVTRARLSESSLNYIGKGSATEYYNNSGINTDINMAFSNQYFLMITLVNVVISQNITLAHHRH